MNENIVYPPIKNFHQTERYKVIPPWLPAVSALAVLLCVIASLLWMSVLEHFTAFALGRSSVVMIAVAVVEVLNYYLSEQIAAVLIEVIGDFLVIFDPFC